MSHTFPFGEENERALEVKLRLDREQDEATETKERLSDGRRKETGEKQPCFLFVARLQHAEVTLLSYYRNLLGSRDVITPRY